MNQCSLLIATLLALAFAPSSQAETAVFESGMIEPFSRFLPRTERPTAEYEKEIASSRSARRASSIHCRTHPSAERNWETSPKAMEGTWPGRDSTACMSWPFTLTEANFPCGHLQSPDPLLDLKAGTVSTLRGPVAKRTKYGAPAAKAKFNQPYTVALDLTGEKLLITDSKFQSSRNRPNQER